MKAVQNQKIKQSTDIVSSIAAHNAAETDNRYDQVEALGKMILQDMKDENGQLHEQWHSG